MTSDKLTVKEYLASLPEDRRTTLEAVRAVILKNLDPDLEEGMQYGMIGYYIPHRVYPAGYHCDPRQPLPYIGLGSQKNHMSLYLMCVYMNGELRDEFQASWIKAGKKLDMGKACIRFKTIDDVALDVLATTLRRVTARKYIAVYESLLPASARKKAAKKVATPVKKAPAAKKTVAKKTVAKTVVAKKVATARGRDR